MYYRILNGIYCHAFIISCFTSNILQFVVHLYFMFGSHLLCNLCTFALYNTKTRIIVTMVTTHEQLVSDVTPAA
jgi:hypothetical protein